MVYNIQSYLILSLWWMVLLCVLPEILGLMFVFIDRLPMSGVQQDVLLLVSHQSSPRYIYAWYKLDETQCIIVFLFGVLQHSLIVKTREDTMLGNSFVYVLSWIICLKVHLTIWTTWPTHTKNIPILHINHNNYTIHIIIT